MTRAKLSAAVCALVAAVTAASPARARELRLGLITPPTHLWTKAGYAFGEELEVASGGSHRLAVFPARQLGTEAQSTTTRKAGGLMKAPRRGLHRAEGG